jgi:hypothetical protein
MKKKDIYYIIFICKKKNVYLTCLKLTIENIKYMKYLGFTNEEMKN